MRRMVSIAVGLSLLGMLAVPQPARAQSDPLIGQLMLVGFNFCPRGWAPADGQLLSIAQNSALFSLLGTTYGGGTVEPRSACPISVAGSRCTWAQVPA